MSQDSSDNFRAQYESEERDRALIRQELERGVPEDQIEEHVALQSDFVRLRLRATTASQSSGLKFSLM
jgi:hypothetical protein